MRRRHGLLGPAVWVTAFVAATAVLSVIYYLASLHAGPADSDGATVVLEGKALLSGNLLLNHWFLSLDSFWLVDAPVYALFVAIDGVRPQLLHLVPAVTAAAVVITGALTAALRRSVVGGIAGGLTVFVLLGLPVHGFAQFLLLGPLHVVTVLFCLGAFLCLRRARFGLGWIAAVVLLAAGMLGDLQTLVLGVAPITVAGVVLALRGRSWRIGVPAVTAAIASGVVAEVVRTGARSLGTFVIQTNPRPVLAQRLKNVLQVPRFIAELTGVHVGALGGKPIPIYLEVAHGIGLAVAVVAGVAAIVSLARGVIGRSPSSSANRTRLAAGEVEDAWLDDVMLLAALAGAAVFAELSLSNAAPYARYLTGAVVFGAIVAGRYVARLAPKVPAWVRGDNSAARGRSAVLMAMGAGVIVLTVAGYVVAFTDTLAGAVPFNPAVRLGQYLERHHLTRGLGDYWSASIVTVETGEAVVVRPVASNGSPRLLRYLRSSTSYWYTGKFQFVVFNYQSVWGDVDGRTAVQTYGRPETITTVGNYRIYVWSRPITAPVKGTS